MLVLIPSECRERKVKYPAPWGGKGGKASAFQGLPWGIDTFHLVVFNGNYVQLWFPCGKTSVYTDFYNDIPYPNYHKDFMTCQKPNNKESNRCPSIVQLLFSVDYFQVFALGPEPPLEFACSACPFGSTWF
jgi:hypothetical protein